MKLSDIIQVCDVLSVRGNPDVEIIGLTNDSRRVGPGSLFIAVTGCGNDGRAYLEKAVENGAAAITPGGMDWLGLALVCVVLPAILCWIFGAVERKLGWIKEGDLKLN